MDVEYDEEIDMFEPHTMTDPVTGEQAMVTTQLQHLELTAKGWIHQGE